MAKPHDFFYKILLIGDSGVGKTALILKYANESIINFITTVGIDFTIKTVIIEDKIIKLQIWDTAGQERFRTITTAYYRGATGIMLLYDITRVSSFDSITRWVNDVEKHTDGVEMMIIGNKCDQEDLRNVSSGSGERLAQFYGASFMETSAITGFNVEEAFMSLVTKIKHKKERNFDQITTEITNSQIHLHKHRNSFKESKTKSGWC